MKGVCVMPGVIEAMSTRDKEFEASNDLRTLREAEEIRGNKKRLSAAMVMAKKDIKELEALRGKK